MVDEKKQSLEEAHKTLEGIYAELTKFIRSKITDSGRPEGAFYDFLRDFSHKYDTY